MKLNVTKLQPSSFLDRQTSVLSHARLYVDCPKCKARPYNYCQNNNLALPVVRLSDDKRNEYLCHKERVDRLLLLVDGMGKIREAKKTWGNILVNCKKEADMIDYDKK